MSKKQKPGGLGPNDATAADYEELAFWLWASLHDAGAYLESYRILSHAVRDRSDIRTFHVRFRLVRQQVSLDEYHFITAIGKLMRVLQRAQHLFPTIQPAYSRANHLINEGKRLRNMIEHLDEYQRGQGAEPDKFVREVDMPNFPGGQSASVDAPSTLMLGAEILLGGRFSMQQAMSEIRAIQVEVDKITSPPISRRPP